MLADGTEKVAGLCALQLTIATLWSSSCPCPAATSEWSLQMVSGCSQWLIWWLIGAPIKASGMPEPPGRNTEWIINSTKLSLFCIATEAVIPRAARVRGRGGERRPLTPTIHTIVPARGTPLYSPDTWPVRPTGWIPHSWLVSTLAHNAQTKGDF